MSESSREFFDTLARVLLRCWILGFVLLLMWFGGILSGAIYQIHGPLMDLSRDQLNVIHYCGLGVYKLLVLTLFFIPWLSIRLALWK